MLVPPTLGWSFFWLLEVETPWPLEVGVGRWSGAVLGIHLAPAWRQDTAGGLGGCEPSVQPPFLPFRRLARHCPLPHPGVWAVLSLPSLAPQ